MKVGVWENHCKIWLLHMALCIYIYITYIPLRFDIIASWYGIQIDFFVLLFYLNQYSNRFQTESLVYNHQQTCWTSLWNFARSCRPRQFWIRFFECVDIVGCYDTMQQRTLVRDNLEGWCPQTACAKDDKAGYQWQASSEKLLNRFEKTFLLAVTSGWWGMRRPCFCSGSWNWDEWSWDFNQAKLFEYLLTYLVFEHLRRKFRN